MDGERTIYFSAESKENKEPQIGSAKKYTGSEAKVIANRPSYQFL